MDEKKPVSLVIAPEAADTDEADRLRLRFFAGEDPESGLTLRLDGEGLTLVCDGQELKGDFSRLLPRLKTEKLAGELLVRTAKIKGAEGPLTAVDATAGLGEDSFLLAAAGFHVRLYEKNPVVYELLYDAWRRAMEMPVLSEIAGRMQICHGDSIQAMQTLEMEPDVVLLDPMFPARQKSALVKKKLQMIQKLETPCMDERALFLAAVGARPKKLIIKRPPKGPWLADIKPDYSIEGKAVRFDCIVSPHDKIRKFI